MICNCANRTWTLSVITVVQIHSIEDFWETLLSTHWIFTIFNMSIFTAKRYIDTHFSNDISHIRFMQYEHLISHSSLSVNMYMPKLIGFQNTTFVQVCKFSKKSWILTTPNPINAASVHPIFLKKEQQDFVLN